MDVDNLWQDQGPTYPDPTYGVIDMLSKEQLEKLMVDAGHAINANNGKCFVIEDVLVRTLSLCHELTKPTKPPGPPNPPKSKWNEMA